MSHTNEAQKQQAGDSDEERGLLANTTETPQPSAGNNENDAKKSFSGRISRMFGGKVVFACFLYSFCSVMMVLTNKSLASSYNYLIAGDLNILLVVFQAIVAVICVEFCKRTKLIEHYTFDIKLAKMWAPVNLFFCGMLFTGMASLQHNSVPMVTVFKNVANIVITAGDWYFFGSVPEGLVIVAFGVMLTGACLAAVNDVQMTWIGLFWLMANCVTTAGYVLYMKFATKTVKLSKFGMVFYNNLLCTLFLVPVAFLGGEVNIFWESKAIHTWEYFAKNVFAGFVGFFLNFASLNCVSATGPTTYAIIGSVNKIPTSIIGYFMFKTTITAQTWFFIGISMLGGFLYSYAKIQSGKKNSDQQPQSRSSFQIFGDKIAAFLNCTYTDNVPKKILTACLIYGVCNVAMVLTNRKLVSSFGDLMGGDLMVLPMFFQAALGVCCIGLAKLMGLVENFGVDQTTIKLWAPVCIIYCAMLYSGYSSIQYASVAMMTVAKCLTNIVVSDGDSYFFGTKVNKLASASLGVLLIGACVTAMGNVEFTLPGLFWMGSNCVTTAAYILYLNYAIKKSEMSKMGMLYHNFLISALLLFPAVLIRDEIGIFMSSRAIHTWEYLLTSSSSGLVGLVATAAGFSCISHAGPTTYAMVGSLSKVPTTILGYLFSGLDVSAKTWCFLFVSTVAGIMYFCAKLNSADNFGLPSDEIGLDMFAGSGDSFLPRKSIESPQEKRSYGRKTVGGDGPGSKENAQPPTGGSVNFGQGGNKFATWFHGRPLDVLGEKGCEQKSTETNGPMAMYGASKFSPHMNPHDKGVRFKEPLVTLHHINSRKENEVYALNSTMGRSICA